MLRSMFSGVSGLRNHQTKMDVIGNNIANVNTVGYKASRVTFQDIYSQDIRAASGPTGNLGGTNPMQIGLGMTLNSIDVMHTRAAAEYTGAPLDLSIAGDGFFAVSDGNETFFTRAGNFNTDRDNNLVNSSGLLVQGWQIIDTNNPPQEGDIINSRTGNLVRANLAYTAADLQVGVVEQIFESDGITPVLDGGNPVYGDVISINGPINIPSNYFDVMISKTGDVVGINDATGEPEMIAKISIANFNNQNALQKLGENLYGRTLNSGDAVFGFPGTPGNSFLNPSSLEMSNVDLAKEFTDMIITQRGFQANSRIITVSDQLLEEVVNLKR